MKKFKIDRNASKKFVALVLTATISSVALTGCGYENKNLLNGTILENSRVITFDDGHVDIAVISSDGRSHSHYKSIVTGEKFASSDCTSDYVPNKYSIVTNESIICYLTETELEKACNGELTNEDVKNVILRVLVDDQQIDKAATR